MAERGEAYLLDRLLAEYAVRTESPRGPGDDAALVATTAQTLIGADMLVEDVDFRCRWASPRDVGHKAAEANLSDLAAMGAQPTALLASLALPPALAADAALALLRAIERRARRIGANLVGGDVSATAGPIVVAVTALGRASRHVLTRHTASLGDVVCVTGRLGAAAAGLALLERDEQPAGGSFRALRAAQLRPLTPVAFGRALGEAGLVTACADVSDGLASDCLHLVPAGAGVEIEVARLPLASQLLGAARVLGSPCDARTQALKWALTGGEDFGLVCSVAPARVARLVALGRAERVLVTPIGRVVDAPGLRLWPPATCLSTGGHQHFVASSRPSKSPVSQRRRGGGQRR